MGEGVSLFKYPSMGISDAYVRESEGTNISLSKRWIIWDIMVTAFTPPAPLSIIILISCSSYSLGKADSTSRSRTGSPAG